MSMTLKLEYLLKYKKPFHTCFIESGTYEGGAVQLALKCGFENIISIEISEIKYKYCVEKFKFNKNVKLINGDSYYEFPKIISKLKEPCVFWLDGHFDKNCDTKGKLESPLIFELQSIALSEIKNHVIMIDDLRVFGKTVEINWGCDFDIEEIKWLIKEINPSYNFSYEDGWAKDDVLIASV